MSKIEGKTITFKGKQNNYECNIYTLDTNFKAVSAIYVFTNRHKNGDGISHTRIYVGKTKDLSQRFDDHHKANCFEKHNANCICIYKCKESELDFIEKDIMSVNTTKCNEQLN